MHESRPCVGRHVIAVVQRAGLHGIVVRVVGVEGKWAGRNAASKHLRKRPRRRGRCGVISAVTRPWSDDPNHRDNTIASAMMQPNTNTTQAYTAYNVRLSVIDMTQVLQAIITAHTDEGTRDQVLRCFG